MTRIPTRRRLLGWLDLSSWALGCISAAAFFALQALAGQPDSLAVPAEQLQQAQEQREQDLLLVAETGRIAREAHAQGMREAIAAIQGTPDHEVIQRTCARLWGMEHAQ